MMAHRIGAGAGLRSFEHEHTDDHGLFRPAGRGNTPIIHFDDYSEYDSDDTLSYSPRQRSWGLGQQHDRNASAPDLRWSPSPEPENRFFIIREGTPPATAPREVHLQPNSHPHIRHHRHQQQHPTYNENANVSSSPVACLMARTDSGRMIMTETDLQPSLACPGFSPQQDLEAALQVKQHMAKPRPHVKRHERILRALIHPRPHADKATDFPLDNAALESIFSAADEIFFQGRLSRRVHWEWSSGCVNMPSPSPTSGGGANVQQGQGSQIIGTTALRRASPPERGGYETLIVLSSPILKDTSYNRRLLISTFLHELIHSYLFICCGFNARHCGGHTDGFKEIATAIDRWAGRGTLRLCDMEADLEKFREEPSPQRSPVIEEYPGPHRHHQGGVEFYELNSDPWSTGPKVVFGAQEDRMEEGRDRCGATSMSSASTLVEHSGWGAYEGMKTIPRNMDSRGHTFAAVVAQPFHLPSSCCR